MNISSLLNPVVRDMPPSGIRKFFDLVNEMKDAISLSIGEPDFDTPWRVREAGIYSLEQGHTHYSPNAGYMQLREEISNYLNRKYSLQYDCKNEIIVTVGGSEAIDLCLRSIVCSGDEVIIPEPCFVAYKPCVQFAGGKPVIIELNASNAFKLTVDMLQKAATSKTKALILPFPNNPTGAIMTKQDLLPIAEYLRDKDIVVISDEIYSELTYDEKHVSMASFPWMKEKTIVINGFSKAFAMTGWRLGYACGPKEIISAMYKIHQYAIMCSPTTSQYAAIEALKNADSEVDSMVREYNRRRRVMIDGFRKAGLDCFEPLGAFYVFPCIKSTGLTSEEFCEKLLLDKKVAVVPGTAFGSCGQGFVRACYASSMDNIVEAMRRINSFVNDLKHRT